MSNYPRGKHPLSDKYCSNRSQANNNYSSTHFNALNIAPYGDGSRPRDDRATGSTHRDPGARTGYNERAAPSFLDLTSVSKKLSKINLGLPSGIRLKKRPNINVTDSVIKVKVNCWDISFSNLEAIMYDLLIDSIVPISNPTYKLKIPVKDLMRVNKVIVETLPKDVVFDGGRIIYSLKQLEGVSTNDVIRELVTNKLESREDLKITYRIREVQRVSTANLAAYVKSDRSSVLDLPTESTRLLDCILRTYSSREMINLKGNAFYYPTAEKIIHDKLFQIHRGFVTSCRPQWKVRINVDMTCRAFFIPGNLADVLYDKYRDGLSDPRNFNSITNDIRGLLVEAAFYKNTKNGKNYKKRLTLYGVSKEPSNKIIISDLNITVEEYFKKHHNIILKYPELPCASMSAKRDVFIPMELLTILPHQQATASKADISSEIVRCAAVKPQKRFQTLDNYVKQMTKIENFIARLYGIKIAQTCTEVEARELPQPLCLDGSEKIFPVGHGKWEISKFRNPASFGSQILYAIVAVQSRGNSNEMIQSCKRELTTAASRLGVNLSGNPICIDRCMIAQIENFLADLQKKKCRFVVLILYDSYAYSSVKRCSDLQFGIPTQCVLDKTLRRGNVGRNLMLKINGKIGGVNWTIPSMVPPKELIQVFGIDVTHPGTAGRRDMQKSIAAVTGSVTPDLMRYGAIVRQQATTRTGDSTVREILDNMEPIVYDLIQVCAKNCNKLPDRLIFYRDGVSEGQFKHVLVQELSFIQRACKSIHPDYEPAVTYITVQKRHHVRFIPNHGDRNVKPGTVVDKEITSPNDFDFFLCSHEGIQGTSTPSHYFVLYDDSGWESNQLQLFTYCLTHAYFRCSRSVSYPAPTYYSHLAAYRARDWLNGAQFPSKLLENDAFKIHPNQKLGMFFL